jgi:hypothetical protein
MDSARVALILPLDGSRKAIAAEESNDAAWLDETGGRARRHRLRHQHRLGQDHPALGPGGAGGPMSAPGPHSEDEPGARPPRRAQPRPSRDRRARHRWRYHGYVITAAPQQSAAGGWATTVHLWRERPRKGPRQTWRGWYTFETEAEARQACWAFGRSLVEAQRAP